MTVAFENFESLDIRVGEIVEAARFPEARKPAYKLKINFGEVVGVKQSSAQITDLYQPEELVGMQIVAVVNFPSKRIAGFKSEVLVLGVYTKEGVILLVPQRHTEPGQKIG